MATINVLFDKISELLNIEVRLWEVFLYAFVGALFGPPLNKLITRMFKNNKKRTV